MACLFSNSGLVNRPTGALELFFFLKSRQQQGYFLIEIGRSDNRHAAVLFDIKSPQVVCFFARRN